MPMRAIVTAMRVRISATTRKAAHSGIKRLKAAKADTPTPQEGLKESVNAVKGAVTSGLQRGNAQ